MNSVYFCLLFSCFCAVVLSGKSPCNQPLDPGTQCGDIRYMKYAFVKDQCERFTFKGCGGNNNRFESKAECEVACPVNKKPGKKPPKASQNKCQLPLETGPCRASKRRWGSKDGQCVKFTYGGCQGNKNRFRSKKKCEAACPILIIEPVHPTLPTDKCQLPLETGPCRASKPRWGSKDGRCVKFTYGGCHGNSNRFKSKKECEAACPILIIEPVRPTLPTDNCQLPLVTGRCRAMFPSWGSKDGRCVQFTYGGCDGNANRFGSKEECEEACPIRITEPVHPTLPKNKCQLPLVTGHCRAMFPSWGSKDGRCVQFTYGGCGGNANRFGSKEECEEACPIRITEPVHPRL